MTAVTLFRQARLDLELTVQEVANETGLNPNKVTRAELGHGAEPATAMRLSRFFGISRDAALCSIGVLPDDIAFWLTQRPDRVRDIRTEMEAG